MSQLRTAIQYDGQRYVDEPIYEHLLPRTDLVTPIAVAVATAFNELAPRVPTAIVFVKGHERVLLRWMKPDGKGGLVPRDGGKR